jgi:hypothetical protein
MVADCLANAKYCFNRLPAISNDFDSEMIESSIFGKSKSLIAEVEFYIDYYKQFPESFYKSIDFDDLEKQLKTAET